MNFENLYELRNNNSSRRHTNIDKNSGFVHFYYLLRKITAKISIAHWKKIGKQFAILSDFTQFYGTSYTAKTVKNKSSKQILLF